MTSIESKDDLDFDLAKIKFVQPKANSRKLSSTKQKIFKETYKETKSNNQNLPLTHIEKTTYNESETIRNTDYPHQVTTLERKKNDTKYVNSMNYSSYDSIIKQKEEEIKSLKRRFREKVEIMENENNKKFEKIHSTYKELIDKINEKCEMKIKEMKEQYTKNLEKINKQYIDILNEIRTIRGNYISLENHYDKLNENISKNDKKLILYKNDNDQKIKQMLNKIEAELKNNNDNIFENLPDNYDKTKMANTFKKLELINKITYSNYILDIQNVFNDFEKSNTENFSQKIKNLKIYAIQKFNDLLNPIENKNKKIDLNISGYDPKHDRLNKKSEIVNYETYSNNNKSINENNINTTNNLIENNNVNYNNFSLMSKSISIAPEKFSSELESFNFNDDTIHIKDIQALSPPEMIK